MGDDFIKWLVGGGLFAILAMIIKVNYDVNKRIDDKVGRMYKRLDETKEYQDKTFTRVDVCKLRHEQISEKLDKMDIKLDKIINGR